MQYTKEQLAELLERHGHWLREDCDGWESMRADLRGADLYGADLRGADLRGADLRGAKNAEHALAMTEIVPREGSFVGWKQCQDGAIVKLRIPEGAKRSNATGRKCRASFADVLGVWDKDGNRVDAARGYYSDLLYRAGCRVVADSWDEYRLNECSHGIHFFLTREEAEAFRW